MAEGLISQSGTGGLAPQPTLKVAVNTRILHPKRCLSLQEFALFGLLCKIWGLHVSEAFLYIEDEIPFDLG